MILEPNDTLLDAWADQLSTNSWVVAEPLPFALLASLQERARHMTYQRAHVGRLNRRLEPAVRSDKLAWTDADNSVDARWLGWLDALQRGLNRRLYLGLTHHESHYALYPPGARYQRHRDTFAEGGSSNRIVSLVLYLNTLWPAGAGGELVLHPAADDPLAPIQQLAPLPGRMVLFLSAELPHEVLPAQQNRYSLAAWFRG